jgi:hemolysin activation/secretion protein
MISNSSPRSVPSFCRSLLAVACFAALPAFAQTPPSVQPTPPLRAGQTPQDIDPAARMPAVPARTIDAQTLAAPGACPFAGQGQVTLSRIEVTGATLVPQAELDAAVADLVGRTGDTQLLCDARDRVAQVYAANGEALARVELPEQRIEGGVLTLRVNEGRIADVQLVNAEAMGPSAALAQAYLDTLKTQGATRWSDVERAFLLVREIPGADVGFSMQRAQDGSPDGLAATATFAPRRKLDITLGAQNLGSDELGNNGVSARIDANSFTRFGERTSLVLYSSTNGAQQVAQLLEEVRVGPSGLVLTGDVAYGRTEPEGALSVLELDGESLVARVGARYPFVRQRNAMLDGAVRLEAIEQDNALGFLGSFGGPDIPLFEESLRVLSLGAEGRWMHGDTRSLATHASIELRQGLEALGSSETGDALLSRPDAQMDFTSVRMGAGAHLRFGTSPAVAPYAAVTAAAQWTDDSLPAYEELQFGNYTIGRGFDPGAASGDRAIALRTELGVEFSLGGAAQLGVFGFADGARLFSEDRNGYDAEPWSAGIGTRLRTRSSEFALIWAAPQSEPIPGTAEPGNSLLLTFSHAFSIR